MSIDDRLEYERLLLLDYFESGAAKEDREAIEMKPEEYATIPVMLPIHTTLPESQFPDLASFKLAVLDGLIDTSTISAWLDAGIFFVQSAYGDTIFAQVMEEADVHNTCIMLHIEWSTRCERCEAVKLAREQHQCTDCKRWVCLSCTGSDEKSPWRCIEHEQIRQNSERALCLQMGLGFFYYHYGCAPQGKVLRNVFLCDVGDSVPCCGCDKPLKKTEEKADDDSRSTT